MRSAYDVIKAPLVTEKSNSLAAAGKYVFKVSPNAEKIEIGKAVEELFNVKVKSVNVMNYEGKAKRAGRTNKMGRRADWKKAIVTLAEGSIEII
ncbi:MAG: 50S ribosomal protein L23 [Lentisphaeria bacterium]|jgi:large subunit ribosomal protein L23|nr:50S ribosomal protein L23 [Lentisphaeria bacterium]MBR7127912.1 50S ribosomal protein L23 [Lentisphaeria bacterium]